eukprot:230859-Pyramimonas_sp.AAC.1
MYKVLVVTLGMLVCARVCPRYVHGKNGMHASQVRLVRVGSPYGHLTPGGHVQGSYAAKQRVSVRAQFPDVRRPLGDETEERAGSTGSRAGHPPAYDRDSPRRHGGGHGGRVHRHQPNLVPAQCARSNGLRVLGAERLIR